VSEWQSTKLGDVLTLNYGKALKAENRIPGNFPVYSSAGLTGYHNESLVKSHGLIVGRKGTVGKVYYSKVPFCCIDTAYYVLPNEFKYSLDYFYYLLQTLGLEELNEDSAVPGLNRETAYQQEFLLPSVPEQKSIASVLSSLDKKIDLLHRQNTTLEAMAETLFRQWFVEKAQEDWEESTIDKIIEFNPPRKLSKGQVAPYLDMAGLDTTNFSATGWYLREFSSGTKFINNDTLLARITPCLENGKTGYVAFLSENEVGWGSTEFIVLRPKLGIHPFFAYVLARYQDFRDYAEGCMEGSSGRQRVNIDHLKQYQIRIPSNEIIKCFNEAVSAITPKLELNAKQIQTLEKLRENLLPKLMSGEVRV
jgi:type I restriction enzyme S subunit